MMNLNLSEQESWWDNNPDGDIQDSNFVVPDNVIDDDDLTVNEN